MRGMDTLVNLHIHAKETWKVGFCLIAFVVMQSGRMVIDMRLIDADAFKKYMQNALEETRGCYPDKGEWAEDITEQFCKDIDDQPTVEPERKKGKWLVDPNEFDEWYCCSVCHKGLTMFDGTYDFCPNCGADMRGGSE